MIIVCASRKSLRRLQTRYLKIATVKAGTHSQAAASHITTFLLHLHSHFIGMAKITTHQPAEKRNWKQSTRTMTRATCMKTWPPRKLRRIVERSEPSYGQTSKSSLHNAFSFFLLIWQNLILMNSFPRNFSHWALPSSPFRFRSAHSFLNLFIEVTCSLAWAYKKKLASSFVLFCFPLNFACARVRVCVLVAGFFCVASSFFFVVAAQCNREFCIFMLN